MTNLLVATFNNGKKAEIKALLKTTPKLRIRNLEDLNVQPPTVVEDGKTFRQNAVKKAVVMSRFFDGLVLSDDSGLEVDVLFGKPGVRSARFARNKATDEENSAKLLKLMGTVPEERRTARFVCCIAIAKEGKLLDTFEGTAEGSILFEPKGENGFGYDPLFVPTGKKKTYAEMTATYKNRISHRAKALKMMKGTIQKFL